MPNRPRATIRPVRRAPWIPVLVFMMLGVGACARDEDPRLRQPALLVDGKALTRLLERTQRLTGTPLAHLSTALLERLADCAEVAGSFESDGSKPTTAKVSTVDRLTCRADAKLDPGLTEVLAELRGGHAGIVQWPIGPAGRLALIFDVDSDGGLAIEGALEGAQDLGALQLLVPDVNPPAAAVLDAAASLAHLQLRPAGGPALSAFIPAGSQGDRLFALKGRLLEGALLEGTLELAFTPPAPGGSVPLAVAALHHRAAAPIESALAEALAQLERTWGIVPSPHRFELREGGEAQGGCYVDLPLLPELAPCWVVTDTALLIGYRGEAIDATFGHSGGTSSPAEPIAKERSRTAPLAPVSAGPQPASRLLVDFDRMRADEQLRTATEPAARLFDLYSRLELEGHADADGLVHIAAALKARP